MFVNLAGVSVQLPDGAAFRIANETRPPGSYLFNSILPERNVADYSVESGNITIRSTMAGLVGMDSPYPPGGIVTASTFLERTAKIANEVGLTEEQLRQLQTLMANLRATGMPTTQEAVNTVYNFINKVIVQPHLDRFEWLRGQALVLGAIDWTFNKKNLVVDYGVPSANFLPNRTGTSSYGGSASVFWSDVRALRDLLENNVSAIITDGPTAAVITSNSVNGVVTAESFDATRTTRRITVRRLNSALQFSQDVGDSVDLVVYTGRAEALHPTIPGTTFKVPFFPNGVTLGYLLAIGSNTGGGFRVGDASTESPDNNLALGYTHIGPTVEGGGIPGRWSNIFTPEHEPYTIRGRGVTNGLPVIEDPTKIARASTNLTP